MCLVYLAWGNGTDKKNLKPVFPNRGFTYIGSSAFPQPQCVICAKALSHNPMKPSLLRRHLETKHANLKNKEFLEQELRRLSSSKTCIKATDTINKKGQEASYMVRY
jgi:hypothetical protein